MSRRLACLTLIAALASAAPAFAQTIQVVAAPSDEVTQTELVRYGDLSIRGSDGQHALRLRLKGAAERVCSPYPVQGESIRPFKACVQKALLGAMDAIMATVPATTLASNGRTGG